MTTLFEVAGLFFLAALGVSFFGYLVVRGAEMLADKYKLDRFMIGFILLSVLTSTPEWTVALISAVQGVVEISVGDIFGSNIVNISLVTASAMIFSRTALTMTVTLSKSLTEVLYLSTLIPLIMLYFPATTSAVGVLLMSFFALYVFIAYRDTGTVNGDRHAFKGKPTRIWMLILVGGAMLIFSANQLVQAARTFAEITGVSQLEVGAKLVAVSTSAPELVTVAASMKRGEQAMALGNAVGSNLTNVTLILGSLLALSGANIILLPHIYTILFVMIVSTTFWFLASRGKITVRDSIILLLLYAAFLVFGR